MQPFDTLYALVTWFWLNYSPFLFVSVAGMGKIALDGWVRCHLNIHHISQESFQETMALMLQVWERIPLLCKNILSMIISFAVFPCFISLDEMQAISGRYYLEIYVLCL